MIFIFFVLRELLFTIRNNSFQLLHSFFEIFIILDKFTNLIKELTRLFLNSTSLFLEKSLINRLKTGGTCRYTHRRIYNSYPLINLSFFPVFGSRIHLNPLKPDIYLVQKIRILCFVFFKMLVHHNRLCPRVSLCNMPFKLLLQRINLISLESPPFGNLYLKKRFWIFHEMRTQNRQFPIKL